LEEEKKEAVVVHDDRFLPDDFDSEVFMDKCERIEQEMRTIGSEQRIAELDASIMRLREVVQEKINP